ncbi:TPA: hypothetical protein ACG5DM_000912 [Pseudomonas putida]
MNNQITLATRNGIRSVELFSTFESSIAGETFSFAIHRHLSCNTHVKVSDLETGMGITEIPSAGLPQIQSSHLVSQAKAALTVLIETRGAEAVAQVLKNNRLSAQVLNERTVH